MKSFQLPEEFADLYLRFLEAEGYPTKSASFKRELIAHSQSLFEEVFAAGGILCVHRDGKGRLDGFIRACPKPFISGLKTRGWSCQVLSDPSKNSKSLNRWIAGEVKRIRPLLPEGTQLYIQPAHADLLPELRKLGLHASGLILRGRVDRALRALKARYPSIEKEIAELGLDISLLKNAAEVATYVRIEKDEFTRNPQYGWFVSDPAFLKMKTKSLLKGLHSRKHLNFAIRKNRKVVGGFDCSSAGKSGHQTGGMSLNWSRELQGQGLAKYAYWIALSALKKDGTVYFQGGTSQPGVLHHAALMKRKLIGIEVLAQKKPYFKAGYFEPWIKSLSKNPA